jgi:hypothetical protein
MKGTIEYLINFNRDKVEAILTKNGFDFQIIANDKTSAIAKFVFGQSKTFQSPAEIHCILCDNFHTSDNINVTLINY